MAQVGAPIPATLIREVTLPTISSQMNKASLLPMIQHKGPTDFGYVDLWANKNVKDVPFMAGMIMNNDALYVEGGYKFKLPSAADTSTKIIEQVKANNSMGKVGYGGEEFGFVANNDYLGGHGAIITFDKLSKSPELEITDVKRLDKDRVFYKAKMVQGSTVVDDKFIPSELLQPGSKLFKMASARSSEWGQNWDSFAFKGNPTKEYIKQLATAELNVHYNMTREAVRSADHMIMNEVGNRAVKEFRDNYIEYVFMDSPVDPQFRLEKDYIAAGSPGGAKAQSSGLVNLLDDMCFKILAKQENEYLMFGKGGVVGWGDGLDQGRLPVGVYHQLDKNGYKDVYSFDTFSEATILNAYRRYMGGKVPVVAQGTEPVVRIRTGMGGLQLMSPIIERYAVSSLGGYQQQAAELGIIEGNARQGLGVVKPFYTRLRIPAQIDIRLEYEPAFDPIFSSDVLNPMLATGFRLSSYTFLIDDMAMNAGNIKILRDINDERDTTWEHIAGTEAHPLFRNNLMGYSGHTGSSTKTGFSMFFSKRISTPWVVDPTKMLKISLKNPNFSNFSL